MNICNLFILSTLYLHVISLPILQKHNNDYDGWMTEKKKVHPKIDPSNLYNYLRKIYISGRRRSQHLKRVRQKLKMVFKKIVLMRKKIDRKL